MASDCELPFSLSLEQIENLADKICNNKCLNGHDRRLIYFALTGDLEPVTYFYKKRGAPRESARDKALALEVEKIKEQGKKISDLMPELGQKHSLPKGRKVELEAFNKALKNGRKLLKEQRFFHQLRLIRRAKKGLQ
ncbi:MAG: hypothetical protein FIA89_02755 [Geobacter sp.]|nr:hypothetical protein [Geobacter sp.]